MHKQWQGYGWLKTNWWKQQVSTNVCQLKPDVPGHWLNWAVALRALRHTVAPYRVLQRGLCNSPENPDLEALQQTLAEMARPEAAARCLEVWSHSNDQVRASHLFSRQFLGIGTASNDSQALANQAALGKSA